jgi:MFS family permease
VTGSSARVRRTYYVLTAGNTLAASLIWGINTIFLIDAGLTNLEAFAANAFYTAGMVIFEIPTGVVADTWGRRTSFLCGTLTLAITTALYVLLWQLHAAFVWWAIVSALLGLGFTFFSGATEAWLVDALTATKFDGLLESVLARGQVISGIGLLAGSVGGGYLAQFTNLGVPYVVRSAILVVVFLVALLVMRDLGFTPQRSHGLTSELKHITRSSLDNGLRVPPIRATMVSAIFTRGVGIYVFYALQPYLLELWGDPRAYGIAGLVAAIVAGAQIVGGLLAPRVRSLYRRRTSALILLQIIDIAMLVLIGLIARFWVVIALIVVWQLAGTISRPIRQTYLNGMIPSAQRATILSFDSLMSSAGGIVVQPALGRAADVWNYSVSYLFSAAISGCAVPFLFCARQLAARADTASSPTDPRQAQPSR